jgi:hypothetical protein
MRGIIAAIVCILGIGMSIYGGYRTYVDQDAMSENRRVNAPGLEASLENMSRTPKFNAAYDDAIQAEWIMGIGLCLCAAVGIAGWIETRKNIKKFLTVQDAPDLPDSN